MARFDDCSPVLFYKPQGISDTEQPFENVDFVLILMTSAQESLFKQLASSKICIDSTHGTNPYDFQLTTILVVDEYGEGIPVAFLLLNRVDTMTLMHFFSVLKIKVGVIKTEIFMSDDAPEFYNAWINIMKVPTHRLLCIWHVDRNWRKNLQKVNGDQATKGMVYKCLRMVMESTDVNKFHMLLNSVLHELLSDDVTRLFGEYFQEYYSHRPQLWAYCYRKGVGINTNMYLESMHKTLKHVYLEGKKVRRLDRCISALMKLVRDKLFDRLTKNIKGKQTYKIKQILDRHRKGLIISSENITVVDDNTWYVKSNSDNEKYYTVERLLSVCNECELVCKTCKICVHMSSCQCTDYFIKCHLCKHIHSVGNLMVNLTKPVSPTLNNKAEQTCTLIVDHNCQHDDVIDCNKRIKSKLDFLSAHTTDMTINIEQQLKLEKALDVAISYLQPTSQTVKEPANKNINQQLRFESTKKKRKLNVECTLSKPTYSEKKMLEQVFNMEEDN
ncbi:uncharacterized protein LOC126885154 [Diabrotica virgifera virgifera]|uniref:Uncharacterized protein LOC114330636 n=1 Tax=Diabrotica virgifera virgifera TaxID=50390 RepID=A0A6P7FLP1_DIAVI|nr:uncharacterized protein LOC126885154 [Diabrotica virgifera virgifera]